MCVRERESVREREREREREQIYRPTNDSLGKLQSMKKMHIKQFPIDPVRFCVHIHVIWMIFVNPYYLDTKKLSTLAVYLIKLMLILS